LAFAVQLARSLEETMVQVEKEICYKKQKLLQFISRYLQQAHWSLTRPPLAEPIENASLMEDSPEELQLIPCARCFIFNCSRSYFGHPTFWASGPSFL